MFNPHMTPGPGIEPGKQLWEATAQPLTTAPSQRHPYMKDLIVLNCGEKCENINDHRSSITTYAAVKL